jgi:hypothetical protein
MPNLHPWINQNEASNKFENDLLSIREDRQKMIRPNCHPTYNERHQKIIELIDWTLEKYKADIKKTQQQNDEQEVIIDNIIDELAKKRYSYKQMQQALLKDEVWKYGGEEDTIDYVLFRIRELTGSRLI